MDSKTAEKLVGKLGWDIDTTSEPVRLWLEDRVANACNILSYRERRLIQLLYGFDGNIPLTLRAAGAFFNIQRHRTGQVRDLAISKIQRAYPEASMANLQPFPQRTEVDHPIETILNAPAFDCGALYEAGIYLLNFLLQHSPEELKERTGLTDDQLLEIEIELAEQDLYLRGVQPKESHEGHPGE